MSTVPASMILLRVVSQGQDWYLLPDKPDRRLKLQLSVDIEDLCDLASNKQEELMVEGTDCRQAKEMKW